VTKYFGLRASVLAVASSFVLAGVPLTAQAAGLGRLVVFSALGQPLRAEIEVTATRQELIDMKPRLASAETFKQAGLEYAAVLPGVRFNLERRPNGQAVIKLTSDRPINDPFLDMLLELNWATGRLVREYTILLDPPEYAAKPSERVSVTLPAPTARPDAAAAIEGTGASSAIGGDVRARALAQVQAAAQPPVAQGPGRAASGMGEGREVRRGDTLHRIATEIQAEGVSLDQMLVGLFRANPEAFDGNNMNRLRTGAILSMPEKPALESVSPREARRIVVAQSGDWNAYRSKLAGVAAASPARGGEARQESGGKITARVDDKAAQAASRDQLKVSRAESASRGKTPKVSDEDVIARDKALTEANDRVAALEKNVSDLQKLLELKNQSLAELQRQVAARPAPGPQLAPGPQPAPQLALAPQPAPAQPAATPAQPAPSVAPPPSPPPQPAPAPAQPAPKPPAAKPRVAAPPPPPPPEPSFFEELLDNPLLLAGGGGVLAIISGYLFWRRRRALAETSEVDLTSTLKPQSTTTSLTTNSIFRSIGGQNVDTSSQTSAQTDFSQAGPGSIDTDEVDPVAEADVYMAYGRDAQAEEILLEARQKDPKRLAITLKLLEIYSGRKDVKQFEALATDLYGETGGVGPDWEKAAAMGRALNHNNPVFRGTVATASAASAAPAAAPTVTASAVTTTTLRSMNFDQGGAGKGSPAPAPEPIPQTRAPSTPPSGSIDFDLGNSVRPIAVPPAGARPPEAANVGDVPDLDFDIGTRIAALSEAPSDRPEAGAATPDLELGGDTLIPPDAVKAAGQAEPRADEQALGDDAVEFDVSLTESTFLGRLPSEPSSFDMTSINLDLDTPELGAAGARREAPPPPAGAVKAPRISASVGHVAEAAQASTSLNPDFATGQLETVVTPTAFTPPQSETATAVNPDFATAQMETVVVSPEAPASQSGTSLNLELAGQEAETVIGPASILPEVGASEEVATKLDLAKAYEEMGDVEGARELLQEVLKEGNASQRESAQAMLVKIGE
jgi:pilus assembly protein FimV